MTLSSFSVGTRGESPPFAARPFGRTIALQSPPLVPELRLWLLSEQVDLEEACAPYGDDHAPPYWAFCWGGGQALARWLLDHPALVRGLEVVDLGTGSGVAAIAAARAGARRVVAVDVDPTALEVARANATANCVDIETSTRVPCAFDILLASDVLYEEGARRRVLDAGRARLGAWVAEPARPGLAPPPLEPVHTFDVRTFPDVDSPTCAASIYRLEPPPGSSR